MERAYSTYKFDEVGLAKETRKWVRVTSRLSDEEIRKACIALSGEKYAPNEDRFVNKAFGIIDSDKAFNMASKYAKDPETNQLNDPLVYCAYCQVGTWAWKNKTDYYLTKDFNSAYADAVQKTLNREKLDIPNKDQYKLEHKKESYKEFKARIAISYGKDVADKHCVHDGWTQQQCIDFIKNSKNIYADTIKNMMGI